MAAVTEDGPWCACATIKVRYVDPRPAADGSPTVQAVAAALLGDVSALADDMLEHLAHHIPEITADPELRGLTLGSCSSNLEAVLSMVRHGIDATAAEAPVTALEHARAMASRGHSLDVMLRFYRLGHQYFTGRFAEALTAQVPDPAESLRLFLEVEKFGFQYIDRISTSVSSEYVAELDRRQSRDRAERSDVVRALLADERVDLRNAETVLGHRLTGGQLGFVCWTADNGVDLPAVAQRFAKALGTDHPLVIPAGARCLWGWVAASLDSSTDLPPPPSSVDLDVHIAVGAVHPGPAGFRTSHRQAMRARRVAELGGWTARVTYFSDIALVDLMTQDLDGAREFVHDELGDLAHDDAKTEAERSALLAFLTAQGSLKAAAETLGVHRNTVLQRVRRAEERIGGPVAARRAQVYAALHLCDVLGASALRPT